MLTFMILLFEKTCTMEETSSPLLNIRKQFKEEHFRTIGTMRADLSVITVNQIIKLQKWIAHQRPSAFSLKLKKMWLQSAGP